MDFREWAERVVKLIMTGELSAYAQAGRMLFIGPPEKKLNNAQQDILNQIHDYWRKKAMDRTSDELASLDDYVRLILFTPELERRISGPPRPSTNTSTPTGPITAEEQKAILAMLDDEDNFRALGAEEKTRTIVHNPIVIMFDAYALRAADVVSLYRPKWHGARVWSPARIEWERAMLEDVILFLATTNKPLSAIHRNEVCRAFVPYLRSSSGRRVEHRAKLLTKSLERAGVLVRESQSSWSTAHEHQDRMLAVFHGWLHALGVLSDKSA